MTFNYFFIVSVILFIMGTFIVMTKRNAIVILMGIELMLNAANLNLVAFNQMNPGKLEGQTFSLFVIVLAAAEAAIALAIVLRAVKFYKTTNVDEISKLKS